MKKGKNKIIIIILLIILVLIIISVGYYLYYLKVYLPKIYLIADCSNAHNPPDTRSCIYYKNINNEKLCNKVGGRWEDFPQAASIAQGKTGKICIVELNDNPLNQQIFESDTYN